MAHRPAHELWSSRAGAIAKPSPPAQASRSLMGWVQRSPVSSPALVLTGVGIGITGALMATINPLGLLGALVFGGMITLGGGLTFLGLSKALRQRKELRALPAAAEEGAGPSKQVLLERARRIRDVLAHGELPFEAIRDELRWTETALLEALVHMKDAGLVEEDLNLETGEWVYRPAEASAHGTPASLPLADRQARAHEG